jgi:hypothetical protein
MTSTTLQPEQHRKIWLYFLDTRVRYAVVLFFFSMILVETSFGKALLLLDLTWLAGALAVSRARPSDQELDDLLSSGVASLEEKAKRDLAPREQEMQAAPLTLRGPLDLDAPARQRFFTRPRTGQDGARRSPINRVVVLLPMEDRLGVYTCHHDCLEAVTSQVCAEEHHYRDVQSLALERSAETASNRDLPSKTIVLPTQVLSLTLTSGKRLSFPVSVGRSLDSAGGPSPLTGLEGTVRAIQTLIRDSR